MLYINLLLLLCEASGRGVKGNADCQYFTGLMFMPHAFHSKPSSGSFFT